MSKWIKKDDKVIVISGNNKGAVGKILSRSGDRVIVQGVNIRKKHARRRTQEQQSQILSYEMPIHISNVRICDSKDQPVKLRVSVSENGDKELFYFEDDKKVIHRQVKKSS